MVQFAEFTVSEREAVNNILARVMPSRRMSLEMDLSAVHARTPIKLAELAEANDGDFWHDVYGIVDHIDRTTGNLTDCFVPRHAR